MYQSLIAMGNLLIIIGLVLVWGTTIIMKDWESVKIVLFSFLAAIPFIIIGIKFWGTK